MGTKRIPFAQDLETRDGTLTRDSRTVNAAFERNGSAIDFVKRPGLFPGGLHGLPSVQLQGLTAYGSATVYTAGGTNLYTDISGTLTTYSGIFAALQNVYFCRTYLDQNLFFTDGTTFYNSTQAIPAPTNPVPPIAGGVWVSPVWLNNYVYIGNTRNNLIYSCHSGDPTTWTGTSNIAFYQTNDTLVGLANHLNYIVAFGQKSAQFYYDAGTGDGATISSLAVATSYDIEIGCANKDSIASAENTVVWVGVSQTVGTGVYMLNGVTPVKISTASIDKIIAGSICSSYIYRFNGHSVYVLSYLDAVTLAYDMTTQMWSQWTSFNGTSEGAFIGWSYTESFSGGTRIPFVIDFHTCTSYSLSEGSFMDDTQSIYTRSITELDDEGSTKMKFYRRAEVVGDTSTTTVQLSYTKDDYNTYSPARTIDMSTTRPAVYQLASSRRRAWQMLHTDNTALRLQALELDFDLGEMDNAQ